MFKRRTQQPVHERVGYIFWPRTGWSRAVRYLGHRTLRLHGTPYAIAIGIAWGAAISFTPLIGSHFLLAAFFTWLMGGNMFAALIGTVVGNPWTFPFIWLWTYQLGTAIGAGSGRAVAAPNFTQVFADLMQVLLRFDFGGDFFDKVWAVWWPMMVGSVPNMIVVWLATYFLMRPVVATYQRRRALRRHRKALRREARAKKLADEAAARQPGLEGETGG